MGSSLCGVIMNRFVVLAACVCASTAQQVVVGGIAGAYNPAPSTQFHAQDEFGQFSFGHAGGPLARTEARNAYGVTTGSSQSDQLSQLLLLLRLQSSTSQSQLLLRIPQRLLLPRLNSRLLLTRPPPLLLREGRERLKRSPLLLLQLSLLSHTHMPLDSTLPMLDSQLLLQLFSQLLPLLPMLKTEL